MIPRLGEEGSHSQGSHSCPSADGHPETMKCHSKRMSQDPLVSPPGNQMREALWSAAACCRFPRASLLAPIRPDLLGPAGKLPHSKAPAAYTFSWRGISLGIGRIAPERLGRDSSLRSE